MLTKNIEIRCMQCHENGYSQTSPENLILQGITFSLSSEISIRGTLSSIGPLRQTGFYLSASTVYIQCLIYLDFMGFRDGESTNPTFQLNAIQL